jgi:hypothetical protein
MEERRETMTEISEREERLRKGIEKQGAAGAAAYWELDLIQLDKTRAEMETMRSKLIAAEDRFSRATTQPETQTFMITPEEKSRRRYAVVDLAGRFYEAAIRSSAPMTRQCAVDAAREIVALCEEEK